MKRSSLLFTGVIVPILALFTAVSYSSQETTSSAQLGYLSPRPGATFVSTETTVALRFTAASPQLLESASITAVGSQSGAHPGRLILADDEETVILQPDTPFLANETVAVTITAETGERPFSFQYQFLVSPPLPPLTDQELSPDIFPPPAEAQPQPSQADPLPLYRTVPNDFPTLDIYTAPGAEDGFVFLSHFNYSNVSHGKAYLLMLDTNGEPVYYNRLYPLLAALDFKKQSNGLLTYADAAQKKFIVMDQSYQIIASYGAGNGYPTDLHDFQILANNHVLILSNDYRLIDMSVIVPGGNPAAVVVGCVVQELDSAGNVVFEWRSFDHIPIIDSNQNLTADKIWYSHCNSIEPDLDGNLLLSHRHLDEVTKINRQTGDIIWRLGGKGNQFTFTNDVGFFYQHDARRLPNGRLSVYDNRTYQTPRYSRGVEYILDEVNLTATRAYEYRHNPDIFGDAMGNYQRLPGGNLIVGWGWSDVPVLTEALADGTTVFELNAENRFGSYRAFKFTWQGYPTWAPKIIGYAEDRTVNLYFSYNGATEIVGYRIYGDRTDPPTTILGGVIRDGFETTFTYEAPTDGIYYFRIMPVLANGDETQYSNSLPVYVNGMPNFLPIVTKP